MKMKKKKSASMKYVDAMAVKDGYVAKTISKEELCATNAKYSTLKGPYDMEYMGMEVEEEGEMED